jgi:hypothetical protein
VIRFSRARLIASLCALLVAGAAHADRRYFVQSYTPYIPSAGTLEFESWTIASNGQGDSTNTAWRNRAEFEYGITDRLTGAVYLNFVQPGGAEVMHFDGPSLETIYRLGEPGAIPLDPAVYLEVLVNGEELEIEPKLLLAQRWGRTVAALNLVGEFESHHGGEEKGETEKSFRVTTGLTRELGAAVALGVEGVYHREIADDEGNPSAIFAGPTINLQATKIQLALGWHPQLWGDPSSSGSLGLDHFPRSEVRMILGIDL